MTRNPAVQNWVTSAQLAGMLANGWEEVDRPAVVDERPRAPRAAVNHQRS